MPYKVSVEAARGGGHPVEMGTEAPQPWGAQTSQRGCRPEPSCKGFDPHVSPPVKSGAESGVVAESLSPYGGYTALRRMFTQSGEPPDLRIGGPHGPRTR